MSQVLRDRDLSSPRVALILCSSVGSKCVKSVRDISVSEASAMHEGAKLKDTPGTARTTGAEGVVALFQSCREFHMLGSVMTDERIGVVPVV